MGPQGGSDGQAHAAASSGLCRRLEGTKKPPEELAPPRAFYFAYGAALCPAITALPHRKSTDSIAGCRENRVGDSRQNRRHGRFAQAGRVVVALEVLDLDFHWRGGHAEKRVFIEVGLDHATLVKTNLLTHHGAHAIDDGSLDHVVGHAGVYDLTAHVGGHPDLGHLDLLGGIHLHFRDFGEIAAVAEVERDASAGSLG